MNIKVKISLFLSFLFLMVIYITIMSIRITKESHKKFKQDIANSGFVIVSENLGNLINPSSVFILKDQSENKFIVKTIGENFKIKEFYSINSPTKKEQPFEPNIIGNGIKIPITPLDALDTANPLNMWNPMSPLYKMNPLNP